MKKIKNEKIKRNIKNKVMRNKKTIITAVLTFMVTFIVAGAFNIKTAHDYGKLIDQYEADMTDSVNLISEQNALLDELRSSNEALTNEIEEIRDDNDALREDVEHSQTIMKGYNKICDKAAHGEQVRIPVYEQGKWYYYTGTDKQLCASDGVTNYLVSMTQ